MWKYFFKTHLGVINPEVRNTAYIIIHLLRLGRLCQNKATILQGIGMDLDKATSWSTQLPSQGALSLWCQR